MYVVDVLPLAASAPAGTLSYRSSTKLPIGSVVTVTLRRSRVPAIVLSTRSIQDVKALIKSASYALTGDVSKPTGRIPQPFMDAIDAISAWHAAPQGSVLSSLIGELVKADAIDALGMKKGRGFALLPLELPLRQRAARYHELIRETIEKEKSILLVVSTLAEVEYWKHEFAAYKTIVLSGSLTGARRTQALQKARLSPAVVISTPTFSFIPIPSLWQIVIERAGAGGFRMSKRPYLDMRVALIEYARAFALPLTLGDFPLPLEYRKGVRRFSGDIPEIEVLDTRTPANSREPKEPWSAVPLELRERIERELSVGNRVAVLAVRKGYAPVVVCRDCGEALKDERGKVFTFSQQGGERVFRTSDGKSVRAADNRCPRCESWNLLPLGVGVERVAEELHKTSPKAPLVVFDADIVRSAASAKKQLTLLSEPGSIVVGTEAMVPWLFAASPEPISLAAVASADSLLALPFWRSRERFVRLSFLFAECANRAVVCTRLPDDTATAFLRNPSDTRFFEEEESLRRALSYPPFGTLISLSFEGTLGALEKQEAYVRNALPNHSIRSVPDRPVRARTLRRTLVLSLSADSWPEAELSAALSVLPPSIRIMVDPESFW